MEWLAKLGQDIQFVAFWAHFGAAEMVVEHLSFGHKLGVCTAIMVLAGIKEFWYDARYEENPPQTFQDNLEDWVGWALGALVGVLL